MGLLIECPKCRTRNSPKADKCKCGLGLKKLGSKSYWIEFYDETGKRRRERVGPSKTAAEQRLRDVLKARTEERFIYKDLSAKMSLEELCSWYRGLPEVKAKKTYKKELSSILNLKRLLGAATKLKELTAGRIEGYQRNRLAEPSPRHPGEMVRPATVNREIACLKTMMSRAVHHKKLNENSIAAVRRLPENNVRMRILNVEEFERLFQVCPQHVKPIVMLAFYTGMRKSEIVELEWHEVDLNKGFIRLMRKRTKTEAPRSIPLHPRVRSMLERLPRGIHTDRVFLKDGRPFDDFKKAYTAACKKALIEDFTFHDLRHCALNNLRLAGNDYFKIMAISGHKTMSVFKRYNLVTEEELTKIVWSDQQGAAGL
jgi:integrase